MGDRDMSITVTCPACKEKNIGSALHCAKCDTNLIGVPREGDTFPPYTPIIPLEATTAKNKHSIIEGRLAAVWRAFRSSIIIAILAMLVTVFIDWSLNMRTWYEFGDSLFYTSASLAIIGWYIFNGNQGLARSQMNPLNPMNRAMPGTFSERTRQNWLDHLAGMVSVSILGTSAALCFIIGAIIVNLAK
jgi:hypothetical protein